MKTYYFNGKLLLDETNKKIDVGDFTANIDKIKKEIGWRARVPLEEGLSQTIQFYKENKKYYW